MFEAPLVGAVVMVLVAVDRPAEVAEDWCWAEAVAADADADADAGERWCWCGWCWCEPADRTVAVDELLLLIACNVLLGDLEPPDTVLPDCPEGFIAELVQ